MIGTFVNGQERLVLNSQHEYIAILRTGRVIRVPEWIVNQSINFLDDDNQPIDASYVPTQEDIDDVLSDLDTWMQLGY